MNIFTLTVRGPTLDYRRQILTTKVGPRAVRVNMEGILRSDTSIPLVPVFVKQHSYKMFFDIRS